MFKHTGLKPFRCPFCRHSSALKFNLLRHIKNKHADFIALGTSMSDQQNSMNVSDKFHEQFSSLMNTATTGVDGSIILPSSIGGGELERSIADQLSETLVPISSSSLIYSMPVHGATSSSVAGAQASSSTTLHSNIVGAGASSSSFQAMVSSPSCVTPIQFSDVTEQVDINEGLMTSQCELSPTQGSSGLQRNA